MSWEDDLQSAPGDPEAAARVLGHAAGFMRRGEALPVALAAYLADAFEDAARPTERKARADSLAANLFLFGRDGRPRASVGQDEAYLSVVFGEGSNRAECAALASRQGVSPSTIRNRVKAAAEQLEKEAAEQQRMIDSMTESELTAWLADPYDEAEMLPGVQKRD